ncbi:hypothetical protein Bbelb_176590 [Branchiostoma belcheri]|nr:hypothetical protein Bbelb_176590 [Branchiostoma belcheri]
MAAMMMEIGSEPPVTGELTEDSDSGSPEAAASAENGSDSDEENTQVDDSANLEELEEAKARIQAELEKNHADGSKINAMSLIAQGYAATDEEEEEGEVIDLTEDDKVPADSGKSQHDNHSSKPRHRGNRSTSPRHRPERDRRRKSGEDMRRRSKSPDRGRASRRSRSPDRKARVSPRKDREERVVKRSKSPRKRSISPKRRSRSPRDKSRARRRSKSPSTQDNNRVKKTRSPDKVERSSQEKTKEDSKKAVSPQRASSRRQNSRSLEREKTTLENTTREEKESVPHWQRETTTITITKEIIAKIALPHGKTEVSFATESVRVTTQVQEEVTLQRSGQKTQEQVT